MADAERAMYKTKKLNRQSVNKELIDSFTYILFSKNAGEKRHAQAVMRWCAKIGTAMGLPNTDINKLKRTAYLHDIDKITLDANASAKGNMNDFSEEEIEKIWQHPVVGYRILNMFDETLDIAEYVYGHHERWDGSGYPRGLKGEGIPLISRIVLVAETYDRVEKQGNLSLQERKADALKAIREGSGIQFDPSVAELFVQLTENEGK